jgi:hypothetical protein
MSEHPVFVDIHESSRFTPQTLCCERVKVAVGGGQAVRVGPVFASLQLGSASGSSEHSTPLSQHGPPLLVQKGVQLSSLIRADAILTVAAERA